MEYSKKITTRTSRTAAASLSSQRAVPVPVLQKPGAALARSVQAFAMRPATAQKQVAQPALQAAGLHRTEAAHLKTQRSAVTEQISAIEQRYTADELSSAVQRHAAAQISTPVPLRPQNSAEWVTVMRHQAAQAEGRWTNSRESQQFAQLQRHVSHTLLQSYRVDRQPPLQRQAEYASHLAALQRHPLSAPVAGFVLNHVPQAERPILQRAVADLIQRQQEDEQAARAASELGSLQRQLAELNQQATQPVIERIQARRGSGNPLPAAVQRHLEQGLNHDLSKVRIHDDAEADKMAKGVNAIAFTTGTDIFFQSGKFNPNTQSGLELLAHEVTHTVQQSQGKVGKGIDPDSGLESEAREMGRKLAHFMPSPKSLIPPVPHKDGPHAPGKYIQKAALQRAQDGAASYFALKPLYDLQPQSVQRAVRGDLSIQRFGWGDVTNTAGAVWDATGGKVVDAAAEWTGERLEEAKKALMGTVRGIPGYRELSLAVGHDILTGGSVGASGEGILESLANWVPGPLKDILRALKETNVIGKAWSWFQGELGKLNLGGILTEVKDAILKLPPDVEAATRAVTSRISGVKNLIVGSAQKIAEIGLTAITAMLGPFGQKIMNGLRGAGDVIVKILKDPASFARNLLEAVKGGFSTFGKNAPKHLQNGVGQWLTGSTGIAFPAKFDLAGVFMTALTVMGLTYQAMRGKLVKALGPGGAAKVQKAETTVSALQTLKGGLHKADEMKGEQGSVGKEVSDGIKQEVTKSLVLAGIQKLVTMLIPGGGFINAIIGAFQTVQVIVQQAAQIGAVITSALGSVAAIAAGNIGGAIGLIDNALGGAIPVALAWLSKMIGLGNFGGKVKNIIQKVRGKLDRVTDKIVAKIKGIIEKLLGKSKMNVKLSTSDKKRKLNSAITGIKPEFTAMVRRHAPVKELQDALPGWQQKYGLTRLWMTKTTGQFTLRAKVNPEGSAGTAYKPSDNDLRVSSRKAVDQLMKSSAVQSRANEFKLKAQQLAAKGGLAGSVSNPFQVHSGLDTLALLVYSRQTPVTPEKPISGLAKRPKGQSETHFDYGNGLTAQHGQWQAGTNTFVRKMGNYDQIAAMMESIKTRTRRSDALIATDIQFFVNSGSLNPIYSSVERQQITALRHLLTYSESVRSPDNAAHSMMILDRIASGKANWKTGLQELPMHIKGAAGAKRGLEILDQKIENISPGTASIVRKFLPGIAALRKKEAELTRKWMESMKNQTDSIFKDKNDMSSFILSNMNKFYGLS